MKIGSLPLFVTMTLASISFGFTGKIFAADFEWSVQNKLPKDNIMEAVLPFGNAKNIPIICRGLTKSGTQIIGIVKKNKKVNLCLGRGYSANGLFASSLQTADSYELIFSSKPISQIKKELLSGKSLFNKRAAATNDGRSPWADIAIDEEGNSRNFPTNWTFSVYASVSAFSDTDRIIPVCANYYNNEVYVGFVDDGGHCVSTSLSFKKGIWTNYYILRNSRSGPAKRSGWYPQLPGTNYLRAVRNSLFNNAFDYVMNNFSSSQVSNSKLESPDRILCRTKLIGAKFASHIESNELTDPDDVGGIGFLSADGNNCIVQGIAGSVVGKTLPNYFEVFGSDVELSPVLFSKGKTVPVDVIEAVSFKSITIPVCYGLTAMGEVTGFVREDGKCHALTTDGLNIVVTSDFYFLKPSAPGDEKLKLQLSGFTTPKSFPSKPQGTISVPTEDMVKQFSEPGEICSNLNGVSAEARDAKVSAALGSTIPLGNGQLISICNEVVAGVEGSASGSIEEGGRVSGQAEAIIRSQIEFSGEENLGMGIVTTHTAEIETNLGANAEGSGDACWTNDCMGAQFAGGVFVGSTVGVSGRGSISSNGNKLGAGGGLDSDGAVGAFYTGGAKYQDGVISVGVGGSVNFLLAGLSLQLEFAVNTNTILEGVVYAQYLTNKGPVYIGYAVKNGTVVAAREVSKSVMTAANQVASGIIYSSEQVLYQGGKYFVVAPKLLTSGLVTVKDGVSYVGKQLSANLKKEFYPSAAAVASNAKVAVYSVGRAADLGSMKLVDGVNDITKVMSGQMLAASVYSVLDTSYKIENAARDVASASRKAGSYVSGVATDLGKTYSQEFKDGIFVGWDYSTNVAKRSYEKVRDGLNWFGNKVKKLFSW